MARFGLKTFPATLKVCSAGADEADILRYFSARDAWRGKVPASPFRNYSGLHFQLRKSTWKYPKMYLLLSRTLDQVRSKYTYFFDYGSQAQVHSKYRVLGTWGQVPSIVLGPKPDLYQNSNIMKEFLFTSTSNKSYCNSI